MNDHILLLTPSSELTNRWQTELKKILIKIRAPENLTVVIQKVQHSLNWLTILAQWDSASIEKRFALWHDFQSYLLKTAYQSRAYCLRCGDCCVASSPTLHREDMALFENHALSWSHVYTIRKGEKVFSPIENRFLTLNAEMIKIKEIPKTKLCLFFVSNQDRASECAIYGNRPLQCKAQKCWDTRDIEKTFKKVKLTRKEIIRGHNALVELIDAHDERCKTADFYTAMTDFQENNRSYALWDIVAYDMEFRRLITAQLSVQQEEIDFLFGRSFHELLNAYGYTVEQP